MTASVEPAARSSIRRPSSAVRPFIGRVAACGALTPRGIGTTHAAGTTTSSAWAPPSGSHGPTTAMTDSPTDSRPPAWPSDSMVPAASIPGVNGGSTALRHMNTSIGLTAAAVTRSRTSPGCGSRTVRSSTVIAPGPSALLTVTARMAPWSQGQHIGGRVRLGRRTVAVGMQRCPTTSYGRAQLSRTGRDSRPFIRLTERQRSSSGRAASDIPGKRSSRVPRAISASIRARGAPRQ